MCSCDCGDFSAIIVGWYRAGMEKIVGRAWKILLETRRRKNSEKGMGLELSQYNADCIVELLSWFCLWFNNCNLGKYSDVSRRLSVEGCSTSSEPDAGWKTG